MGARIVSSEPTIRLAHVAVLAIRYASIEVFPKESLGWLVGSHEGRTWRVDAAIPTQVVKSRSCWGVDYHEGSRQAEDLVLDESTIGDFHSHPNHAATASTTDRGDMMKRDGWCFVIASIYPSRRAAHNFGFRFSGYVMDGSVRRAKIEFEGE